MKTISLVLIQILFINSLFSEVKAEYNNNTVGISWANPLHIDVDYFVIEKSKSGKKYKEVLKVDGIAGLDKSIAYYEVDYNPFKEKGFYRIKQVDINGQIYYSNIVVARKMDNINSIFKLFARKANIKGLKNYKGEDILVILRNANQEEFIARVNVIEEGNKLITTATNVKLRAGEYLVTATSDDRIYGRKIDISGSYTNSAYTLSKK
jgi:hypothetical protein